MSINLIAGLVGGLAVIGFVVWVVRRNKKFGRLESEHERAVDYAEATEDINDMEREIDEEDKPDFGVTDSASKYLGGMRDRSSNR